MRRTSGEFRDLVTVRRVVQVADTTADLTTSHETVCTRRARFVTGGGRERQQLQQIAEGASVLELQYDSVTRTIDPQMQVLFGSRLLEIVSSENVDELNETIRLTCVEVKS